VSMGSLTIGIIRLRHESGSVSHQFVEAETGGSRSGIPTRSPVAKGRR
jgi:hypothetical protein